VIVYSTSPAQPFVVLPGDHVIYGASEDHLQGYGQVVMDNRGEYLLNGHKLEIIYNKYSFLRKLVRE